MKVTIELENSTDLKKMTRAFELYLEQVQEDVPVEDVDAAAPEIEKEDVQQTETTEQPSTNSAPVKEAITLEQVRAAFMDKNSKANTAKLKAILTDHNVKKVTDLKEEDFDSVLKALEAI